MTKGVECSGYKTIPSFPVSSLFPCAINWRQLPAKDLIAWAPLSPLGSTKVKQGQVMVERSDCSSVGTGTVGSSPPPSGLVVAMTTSCR